MAARGDGGDHSLPAARCRCPGPAVRGCSIFTFVIRWTSVCSLAETWPRCRGSWARGNCGLNAEREEVKAGERPRRDGSRAAGRAPDQGICLVPRATRAGTDVDGVHPPHIWAVLPAGPPQPRDVGTLRAGGLPRQRCCSHGARGFLIYGAKQQHSRRLPREQSSRPGPGPRPCRGDTGCPQWCRGSGQSWDQGSDLAERPAGRAAVPGCPRSRAPLRAGKDARTRGQCGGSG